MRTMMSPWSSLVLAGTVSAGACGRPAPTAIAGPEPTKLSPTDQAAVPVVPSDAMVAIDDSVPPGLDVALEGEPGCLEFRDANSLIVVAERYGDPVGAHEVDTGTGSVGKTVASDACSMTRSPDGKLRLTTDATAQSVPQVDVVHVA